MCQLDMRQCKQVSYQQVGKHKSFAGVVGLAHFANTFQKVSLGANSAARIARFTAAAATLLFDELQIDDEAVFAALFYHRIFGCSANVVFKVLTVTWEPK